MRIEYILFCLVFSQIKYDMRFCCVLFLVMKIQTYRLAEFLYSESLASCVCIRYIVRVRRFGVGSLCAEQKKIASYGFLLCVIVIASKHFMAKALRRAQ